MDLNMITEIVDNVRASNPEDDKVYIDNENTVTFLARMGGKVCKNSPQHGGGWITEVQIGLVTFIHVSEKRIVS